MINSDDCICHLHLVQIFTLSVSPCLLRLKTCESNLSYHRVAISPSEVVVKHLIIEANPLVVLSQTCHAVNNETVYISPSFIILLFWYREYKGKIKKITFLMHEQFICSHLTLSTIKQNLFYFSFIMHSNYDEVAHRHALVVISDYLVQSNSRLIYCCSSWDRTLLR